MIKKTNLREFREFNEEKEYEVPIPRVAVIR